MKLERGMYLNMGNKCPSGVIFNVKPPDIHHDNDSVADVYENATLN
jgi:hypothetical protein